MAPERIAQSISKLVAQENALYTKRHQLYKAYGEAMLARMKDKIVAVPESNRAFVGRKARINAVDEVEIRKGGLTVFFNCRLVRRDGTDSKIPAWFAHPPLID